jgi:hypothetical protein
MLQIRLKPLGSEIFTCFSTVSIQILEGVEKGRFSSYFCSFFIKNHHIWQQNEVFLP